MFKTGHINPAKLERMMTTFVQDFYNLKDSCLLEPHEDFDAIFDLYIKYFDIEDKVECRNAFDTMFNQTVVTVKLF